MLSLVLFVAAISRLAALPADSQSPRQLIHYFVESIDKDIVTFTHKYNHIPDVPLNIITSAFPKGCQGHERGQGEAHVHSVVCQHTSFFDFGPSVNLACSGKQEKGTKDIVYDSCHISKTTASIIQTVVGDDESSLAIREPFTDAAYTQAILKSLSSACAVDKSNSSVIHCPPHTSFAGRKYVISTCERSSPSFTTINCTNDLPTSWPVQILPMSFRIDGGLIDGTVEIVPMQYIYEPDPYALVSAFPGCKVEQDGGEDVVVCPETETLSVGSRLWVSCLADKNKPTQCRRI